MRKAFTVLELLVVLVVLALIIGGLFAVFHWSAMVLFLVFGGLSILIAVWLNLGNTTLEAAKVNTSRSLIWLILGLASLGFYFLHK